MRDFKKAGVIAGLSVALFAGSVASASFITTDAFKVFGGQAKPLADVVVSNGVVNPGMLPGEKADIRFKVKNPNSIPATATFHASSVETIAGDERCAAEIVLNGSWQVGRQDNIPAGEVRNVTLLDHVQLKWDAPNYCQGYKFNVRMTSHTEAGGYRTTP
jgi:hypothetical protein